ncbi:MAG: hypothetical protein JWO20_992 [Candidatus Angelobacter sp.]|nr:hypothetical protein [Candidatus Angelobacter sp.]
MVTGCAFESGRADPTANLWAVPLRPCPNEADNYTQTHSGKLYCYFHYL